MKRYALFIGMLFTACAPRFYPPQTELPVHYANAADATVTMTIDSCWWRTFGDTTLNRLVEQALETTATLRRRGPNRGGASNLRHRTSPISAASRSRNHHGRQLHRCDANRPILYRRAYAFVGDFAFRGSAQHAPFGPRTNRIVTMGLYGSPALAGSPSSNDLFRTLGVRTCSIDRPPHLRTPARIGRTDRLDAPSRHVERGRPRASRSLVYEAEADIPRYERAVEEARWSLAVLLGETTPQPAVHDSEVELERPARLAEIPVGLPSELLDRRPDLQENRYALLAAAAEVGIARSARFPSIALTAKGGVASATLKGLTGTNPWTWDAAVRLLPRFSHSAS